jgi:L-lactate dehydrogenase complex protein LldG
MALGNKTLEDLLAPISKQLDHNGVAEKLDLPEWEFKASRVTDGLSQAELIDMFAAEAAKVRVDVARCSKDGLAACIAEIVGKGTPDGGEPCTVVCANDDRFAQAGLYDAIEAQELVTKLTVWNNELGDVNIDDALVATYGITYTTGGIAETATVVQPTNPQCGRAISLLPLVHIAVVNAEEIKPTMLEFMQEFEASGSKLPSQVCFISGPSATADIELVRVEGVHGPMYVNYVIVE